jgi:anti-anti-sigma factor
MEVNVRESGQVTIIDLHGNLTIGRSEESLRETITRLLAEDRKLLLINLADVPTIDSSGIGAMIKSYNSVKEAGGRIKLMNPSRIARQLLSITGLLSVLETFDDEEQAVKSF